MVLPARYSPTRIESFANLIKAIANPTRLRLLRHIAVREHTASELVLLCRLSKANLSQHINLLKRQGLVRCIKRGTFCFYSLSDRRLLRALDLLDAVMSDRRGRKIV